MLAVDLGLLGRLPRDKRVQLIVFALLPLQAGLGSIVHLGLEGDVTLRIGDNRVDFSNGVIKLCQGQSVACQLVDFLNCDLASPHQTRERNPCGICF